MPKSQNPLRVFICHASQDKTIVRDLYKRFKVEGWIDPWLDEEKLYPGQNWNLEIEKAVEAADAIVVCLSKNSITKEGYVQRELRFALDIADFKPEGTLFVIPVRLEECEPPRRLRVWQYADYFPKEDRDRAYERLLFSLSMRARRLGIAIKNPTEEKARLEALEKAKQEQEEEKKKAAEEKTHLEAQEKAERVKKEQEQQRRKAAQEKTLREALEKPERAKNEQEEQRRKAAEEDISRKKPFSFKSIIIPISLAGIILLALFCIIAGGNSVIQNWPFSTSNTPTDVVKPSPRPIETTQPTKTPQPTVTQPHLLVAQEFFTEEFEGGNENWSYFVVDGSSSTFAEDNLGKSSLYAEDGLLIFDLVYKHQYVYTFYDPFEYKNVNLEVVAENKGVNDNNVSLICRYTEDKGWYEFNIANNGLYWIYHAIVNPEGKAIYTLLVDGGSNKIKQGKDINTYAITCKDRTLTMFINGIETRQITEDKFSISDGQVGVSVSSFNLLPVKVEFESIDISEP